MRIELLRLLRSGLTKFETLFAGLLGDCLLFVFTGVSAPYIGGNLQCWKQLARCPPIYLSDDVKMASDVGEETSVNTNDRPRTNIPANYISEVVHIASDLGETSRF